MQYIPLGVLRLWYNVEAKCGRHQMSTPNVDAQCGHQMWTPNVGTKICFSHILHSEATCWALQWYWNEGPSRLPCLTLRPISVMLPFENGKSYNPLRREVACLLKAYKTPILQGTKS